MVKKQFVKNLHRFRLVTFDVTDTLLRLKTPPAIQYAKTAASLGLNNIDQQLLSRCFRQEFKVMVAMHPNFGCITKNMNWEQWWLQLVKNIFHCVDSSISATQLNMVATRLLEEYRTEKCWTKIDGAEELVGEIKHIGKRVGVISNFDPSLRQILNAMEMHDFDFVLTSYDCLVEKPNRRIFQIPLEQYGFAASEALHIGNLYDMDYIGARRSGWSSLLITKDVPKVSDLHPTHVYENLRDLINSLQTSEIKW